MGSITDEVDRVLLHWSEIVQPSQQQQKPQGQLQRRRNSREGTEGGEEGNTTKRGSASKGGTQRCRPWDYLDFLDRFKTFRSVTWFAKPAVVSSLQCARHGWVNASRDVLTCACCNAQLNFEPGKLAFRVSRTSKPVPGSTQTVAASPRPGGGDQGGTATEGDTFSDQLSEAHEPLCPWRENACSEAFLQFPALPPDELLADLRARLASLVPLARENKGALPELQLPDESGRKLHGVLPRMEQLSDLGRSLWRESAREEKDGSGRDIPQGDGAQVGGPVAVVLPPGADEVEGDVDSGVQDIAANLMGICTALAVFGWHGVRATAASRLGDGSEREKVQLVCSVCGRRVGAWNFLPAVGEGANWSTQGAAGDGDQARVEGGDDAGGAEERERSSKKRRRGSGAVMGRMHALAQHHSYCPWAHCHPALDSVASRRGGSAASLEQDSPSAALTLRAGWEWTLLALTGHAEATVGGDTSSHRSGSDQAGGGLGEGGETGFSSSEDALAACERARKLLRDAFQS